MITRRRRPTGCRSCGRSSASATPSIPTLDTLYLAVRGAGRRVRKAQAPRGARAGAGQARGGAPPRRAWSAPTCNVLPPLLPGYKEPDRAPGATRRSIPTSCGPASWSRRRERSARRGGRVDRSPAGERRWRGCTRPHSGKIGLLAPREPRRGADVIAPARRAPRCPTRHASWSRSPTVCRWWWTPRPSLTADELGSTNDPDERAKLAEKLDARARGERRDRPLRAIRCRTLFLSDRIDAANCARVPSGLRRGPRSDLCLR